MVRGMGDQGQKARWVVGVTTKPAAAEHMYSVAGKEKTQKERSSRHGGLQGSLAEGPASWMLSFSSHEPRRPKRTSSSAPALQVREQQLQELLGATLEELHVRLQVWAVQALA